jgi:hypothetical protein
MRIIGILFLLLISTNLIAGGYDGIEWGSGIEVAKAKYKVKLEEF